MGIGLDWVTILTGGAIFLARVIDVSIGTIRTICIIHGRTIVTFFLGILEIGMWLVVISTVLNQIASKPILGVFYALGFATGNVVGIKLEKRIAFGHLELCVVSAKNGQTIAENVRKKGYPVTALKGEGKTGPVTFLYIVCERRDLKNILGIIREIEPTAFYTIDQAGDVSKIFRPVMQRPTGWRAIAKRK